MNSRAAVFVLGLCAAQAAAWLWHGPFGAGERLARRIEAGARAQLDRDEMIHVRARLERGPLSRRLILSGPADDFQRGEIERRMELLPGVSDAFWDPASLKMDAAR